MSLDEAIRQEIKQNDATVVVSGRDNLVHKRHGAKKEEETNEEKIQEKKKKKQKKKTKNLDTSPELNVGMRATKLQKSTEKTTRQQSGKCDKLADAHQLSLPPLSLFTARVSPEGERRQRQALSAPEWLQERHVTDRNVRNQTLNKLA